MIFGFVPSNIQNHESKLPGGGRVTLSLNFTVAEQSLLQGTNESESKLRGKNEV